MKRSAGLFGKGVLMGASDIVPGISAGTIAFISGIYEEFIASIKAFSPRLLSDGAKTLIGKGDRVQFRNDVKLLNLPFLVPLLAGIGTAILFLSHVMTFLLESYFSLTMAFFIGLILASSKTIFDHIERHHSTNVLLAILGFVIGISFAFLSEGTLVDPSGVYLVFGGFVAISAMLLPGVSGSFILLVMGLYGFILRALTDVLSNLYPLGLFAIGAVLGIYCMSRAISYLFVKDKSKTLYILLGLVVGGLSVPIENMISSYSGSGTTGLLIHGVLFVLGMAFATLVTHFSRREYLVTQ